MARSFTAGTLKLDAGVAWLGLRAYFLDDGDARRYDAYCQAALGRPYLRYFVRTAEAWRESFRAGVEQDADAPEWTTAPAGPPLAPYRDYLVEYPPGFFLWAMPAALLSPTPDAFRLVFGLFMGLLLTLGVWLAVRLEKTLPPSGLEPARLVGWAALGALAMGTIGERRYDASIALLITLALWAAFTRRGALAGVAIGLAVGSKLIPGLAAPVLALYYASERRWRELATCTGVAVAVAAATLLPLALAGPAALDVLRYHLERPLQVESIYGALLGLGRLFAPESARVVSSYGSANVLGSLDAIARLATPLTLAALSGVYLLTWRRLARATDDATRRLVAVQGTAASLAAFMAFGKVFSPQYLVWLFPLGLVLGARSGKRAAAALLALYGLTQLIFPALYPLVMQLLPWTSALVLARDVGLVAWTARVALRPVPPAATAAAPWPAPREAA